MNIIEFLDAIGPVARVLLLSGLSVVVVLGTAWIAESIGWVSKCTIDTAGVRGRIDSGRIELATITTPRQPAGPLARSLAHSRSGAKRHQGYSYPPYGRF